MIGIGDALHWSCFARNFRSLSSIPSSFPPLRYLYGRVTDLWIATDQLIEIIAARNCPKVQVPPSNNLLNYFICLKNRVPLTSNIPPGLPHHNWYHQLLFFCCSLKALSVEAFGSWRYYYCFWDWIWWTHIPWNTGQYSFLIWAVTTCLPMQLPDEVGVSLIWI